MKKILAVLLLMIFVGISTGAESKTLKWIPPTTRADGSALAAADIAGYKVYCEDKSGAATMLSDVGNVLQYNLTTPCSMVYATTYDKSGFESKPSNKLPAMPPSAPQCQFE